MSNWRDLLLLGTAGAVVFTMWKLHMLPLSGDQNKAAMVALGKTTGKPDGVALGRFLAGAKSVAEAGKEAIEGGVSYASKKESDAVRKV